MDSNVVIDYLSDEDILADRSFIDGIIDKGPNISVVTRIEVQSQSPTTQALHLLNEFVLYSNVHQLTEEVIQTTITLRRKHKIKIPDAIIAATAIQHNFIPITSNTRDFQNIKGLKILNPRKSSHS